MAAYEAEVAALRRPLPSPPALLDLIRHATLAANGHNAQPWQFRLREGGIDILPDLTRRTPNVDPDDHHLFVSLGCAAENFAPAAGAAGGVVTFRFGDAPRATPELFAAIARRQSTRADYDGRPVSVPALEALASAAAIPGLRLVLLTDRPQIERIRDLVVAGHTAQMTDPDVMRELTGWLRFNPAAAMARTDRLLSGASGRPAVPSWLGPMLFHGFTSAASENDAYARQIRSSAGIAVFLAEHADREHWVRVGCARQRFALQAAALGVKHGYINQPVEVAALRPALAELVGLPGQRPDLVLRFGHGPTLPFALRPSPFALRPSPCGDRRPALSWHGQSPRAKARWRLHIAAARNAPPSASSTSRRGQTIPSPAPR